MATMMEIERRTRRYAETRQQVAAQVRALEQEIEAAKRRHLTGIQKAAAVAAAAHTRLHSAIEASPELFDRPRTQVIAGIRVGIQKGKGQIQWDDPGKVVRQIRLLMAEEADALIKVSETPIKKALSNLTATQLKRLGVRVIETGDQVVINPTDTEVDKLVRALLTDAARIEEVA